MSDEQKESGNLSAISKALTHVIVQGILDWKMPIFHGFLFFAAEVIGAVVIGLRDYHDWAAVPDLEWTKIELHGAYAGVVALISFLSKSVANVSNELKVRNGTPTEFQKKVASFGTEQVNKPKPEEPKAP